MLAQASCCSTGTEDPAARVHHNATMQQGCTRMSQMTSVGIVFGAKIFKYLEQGLCLLPRLGSSISAYKAPTDPNDQPKC